jgi:hypothetical protein
MQGQLMALTISKDVPEFESPQCWLQQAMQEQLGKYLTVGVLGPGILVPVGVSGAFKSWRATGKSWNHEFEVCNFILCLPCEFWYK